MGEIFSFTLTKLAGSCVRARCRPLAAHARLASGQSRDFWEEARLLRSSSRVCDKSQFAAAATGREEENATGVNKT